MSRKSNYLIISEKDRNPYELLLNCRHANLQQLKEIGASQNRINSYLKERLIECVRGKDYDLYRLTDKGYKQFQKVLQSDNMRYHSQSPKHDERLAQRYIETKREFPDMKWKNEEDLKCMKRDMISECRERGDFERMEKLEMSSVPDCIITTDVSICYDVITDNYSNVDIIAKEEFSECLQLECKFEKI